MAFKTSGNINYQSSEFTALASAARTAAPTAYTMTVLPGEGRPRGLLVFVNITVNAGGAAAITVTISGKDPVSGLYYTILQSAALSSVALAVLRVHPELTGANNTIAKDVVPENIKISVSHADTNPITYSIGGCLVG